MNSLIVRSKNSESHVKCQLSWLHPTTAARECHSMVDEDCCSCRVLAEIWHSSQVVAEACHNRRVVTETCRNSWVVAEVCEDGNSVGELATLNQGQKWVFISGRRLNQPCHYPSEDCVTLDHQFHGLTTHLPNIQIPSPILRGQSSGTLTIRSQKNCMKIQEYRISRPS